jgi:hypothetical protein
MGQLADYSLDQVAGAAALLLGSCGALLHVIFQPKCTDISLFWGLWRCKRKVPDPEEPEPEPEDEDEQP